MCIRDSCMFLRVCACVWACAVGPTSVPVHDRMLGTRNTKYQEQRCNFSFVSSLVSLCCPPLLLSAAAVPLSLSHSPPRQQQPQYYSSRTSRSSLGESRGRCLSVCTRMCHPKAPTLFLSTSRAPRPKPRRRAVAAVQQPRT